MIPPAKLPLLGVELRNTTDAWKAALTPEQRAALTAEQQQIMADGGW
jgi:Spy/CpxP family protein refolding chaperone